mgnify:CR=1 FL=1
MALERWIKNTAIRVAFLTDYRFARLDKLEQEKIKKRALRFMQRNLRYPVVENSSTPDGVYLLVQNPLTKQWYLRRRREDRATILGS